MLVMAAIGAIILGLLAAMCGVVSYACLVNAADAEADQREKEQQQKARRCRMEEPQWKSL